MKCNFEAQMMLASKLLTDIASGLRQESAYLASLGNTGTAMTVLAGGESIRAAAGQLAALTLLHRTYAHADEEGHVQTAVPWIKGFISHVDGASAEYLNSNPNIGEG